MKTLKQKFWDDLDSIEIVGGLVLLSVFGYGLYITIEAIIERFM